MLPNPLRRWSLTAALAATAALTIGCAAPPPSPPPEPRASPRRRPRRRRQHPRRRRSRSRSVTRWRAPASGCCRKRRRSLGSGARDLVIDPPVDASTGQPTQGAVQMAAQLAGLITRRVPAWNVQPLTRAGLASRPLLLIGTLTAINSRDAKDENADVFRICVALADLATGKLVAKRVDRATLATVDAEPTSLVRDSPTWALDPTTQAYIESCQGGSAGDALVPAYLRRLPAAAMVNEAALAFADNKPAEAYRLYREARGVAERDDLRVLNGLYATGWKSGRKKEAAETFGRIVAIGLETRRLPIKMFFVPGTTTLLPAPDLQAQYAVWLQEIANQVGARETCLRVIGHTSRTGDRAANVVLSQKRAAVIKSALERVDKALAPRLSAVGVGSREIIIGLGTDDLRDALDRRVEFRTVDCS